MYVYVHTYTYTHIYIHTYIHTYIYTYTHTYIHTCIHTYIHTYTAYIYTYTYIDIYLFIYLNPHIYIYIHLYVCLQTLILLYVDTSEHVYIYTYQCVVPNQRHQLNPHSLQLWKLEIRLLEKYCGPPPAGWQKNMPYDAITSVRWDDQHNMVLVDWQSGWVTRTWKGKHFVSTSS